MNADGSSIFDSVQGSYRRVVNNVMPIGGSVIAIMLKMKKAKKRQMADGTMPNLPDVMPIGVIPISARLQESYTFQSDATRLAVESGSQLTDHVILQPIRLDIAFLVCNVDPHSTWKGNLPKSRFTSAKSALEQFIDMWQKREPMSLITAHTVLNNMVCVSLQPDNTAPEWGKLAFRASFQQVSFIKLETTQYSLAKIQGTSKTSGPDSSLSAGGQSIKGIKAPQTIPTIAEAFPTANKGTTNLYVTDLTKYPLLKVKKTYP